MGTYTNILIRVTFGHIFSNKMWEWAFIRDGAFIWINTECVCVEERRIEPVTFVRKVSSHAVQKIDMKYPPHSHTLFL